MAGHNHQKCITGALKNAEEICASKGLRLTETRRRVLEMVWGGHRAVKAYDLIDHFNGDGSGAKPPTIYRALDFLLQHGFIHRIESLNAFVGCDHPDWDHQGNFLICEVCHDVIEIDDSPDHGVLERQAKEEGFAIKSKTIEIKGVCRECL